LKAGKISAPAENADRARHPPRRRAAHSAFKTSVGSLAGKDVRLGTDGLACTRADGERGGSRFDPVRRRNQGRRKKRPRGYTGHGAARDDGSPPSARTTSRRRGRKKRRRKTLRIIERGRGQRTITTDDCRGRRGLRVPIAEETAAISGQQPSAQRAEMQPADRGQCRSTIRHGSIKEVQGLARPKKCPG